MSLTNPPAAVSALNTMLAATTTFPATYGTRVWYPNADISGENATAAALPLAIIYQATERRTKYAVGAGGLAGGNLDLTLCRATDAGTLETEAQAVLSELLALDTGLALREGEVGPCSDPRPGARAADGTAKTEYRSITINLTYGLMA